MSERYTRQIRLPGFGKTGQEALNRARVLVIGAGALGNPVLQYLTGAGVGTLTVVDGDTISLSNLHRQVMYSTSDLGSLKALAAQKYLRELNPEITVNAVPEYFHVQNAEELISSHDIVVDGTDNFATRYLINDACVLLGKTNVHGSVQGLTGSVAVFNALVSDGRSANYRDVFPEPPNPEDSPSCEEAGIIGALPGIVGSMQAMEVIKLITGVGEPLINSISRFDFGRNVNFRLNFSPDPANVLNSATIQFIFDTDYPAFCAGSDKTKKLMKSITVSELNNWINQGEDFQLIDVREPHENEICTLHATLIPLASVPDNADKIDKDKKVVIHCRSGKRSANAIEYLEQTHGYTNLYNLEGGILAWADEIDPTMEKY